MSRTTDISPLSTLLSRVDAVTDGQSPPETISCGFPSIDALIGGGFRRGDLVLLGGDTSSGKSSLALAFAIRAATRGQRSAFLTAEMTRERVLERILGIEARARIDDLRQGTLDDEERSRAGATALRLRDSLPIIERLTARDVAGLESVIRGMEDVQLVVVDPLSAFLKIGHSLDDSLAFAARDLKVLALDANVALLLTTSLPSLSARADRRPTLDDFGGSSILAEQADVVLALYREEMYQPGRDIEGATELIVRKNRNGAKGYVDLYFYEKWERFEEVIDPGPDH
jgi:replicative DNA helicase